MRAIFFGGKQRYISQHVIKKQNWEVHIMRQEYTSDVPRFMKLEYTSEDLMVPVAAD